MFSEKPTIYFPDHFFVKPNEITIFNFTISGNPKSNATCVYFDCPITPKSRWSDLQNCSSEEQNLNVEVDDPKTGYLQHATIALSPNFPGQLHCYAENTHNYSETETAFIYIQDINQSLAIRVPELVVEGDTPTILCYASKYNCSSSGEFKRSDGENIISDNGRFAMASVSIFNISLRTVETLFRRVDHG